MNCIKIDSRIIEECIDTYGKKAQIDVAIEEMSELIKALIKERRTRYGKGHVDAVQNVHEEMADVTIMLIQLILIFDNAEEVQEQINRKMERQRIRLGLPEDSE